MQGSGLVLTTSWSVVKELDRSVTLESTGRRVNSFYCDMAAANRSVAHLVEPPVLREFD
jgi:hypothetical protein